MDKNKRLIIKLIALFLCTSVIYFLIYNNASSYDDSIVKIIDIDGSRITGELLNGDNEGETIELTHEYESSLVYDEKYHEGNFLFVSYSEVKEAWSIIGMKRDYIIVLVLLILFNLLLIVGQKQGFYTVLGLCVNVLIFIFSMSLFDKGSNILLLSIFMTIFFACLILLLINGRNRNTLLSIFSTLSSVLIIGIISTLVIYYGPEVSYDFMEFMPQPHSTGEANLVLISEILIGGLGVIMDISVTITTTATELIDKNPNISKRALVDSCKKVSNDISGTMINVVLLTNIASFLPVFVLAINNDFRISTIVKNNMFFEIVRFLTGSIGIILTIPLAIFIVTKFTRGLKRA
ncbi:MAG: YibE/F family protein [Peptostreptococcaceae bacterium]|nr:YibE/F family protein [Peptostreptococcaceae bacterium]